MAFDDWKTIFSKSNTFLVRKTTISSSLLIRSQLAAAGIGLSAGLNLETFDTILSGTNDI